MPPSLDVSPELRLAAFGSESDKVISAVRSSGDKPQGADSGIPDIRHWKELGNFLEGLDEQPRDPQNPLNSRNPLGQPLNYRICNKCNNPILASCMADHLKECDELQRKKKAAQVRSNTIDLVGSNDSRSPTPSTVAESVSSGKHKAGAASKEATPSTAAVSGGGSSKASKKRAATSQVGSPTHKRQKRQRKTKRSKSAKSKGPVDVEKQCGVPLPNGGFCARSLTCKTHSMGAKRAVPGRSAPYDELLASYQRKNQAKIGAAAAAAQQAKDDLMHGADVAIDDEEETHEVLQGVSKSMPWPLERKVIMPVRMRTGFLRMREMFAAAMIPHVTSNPLGPFQGRAAIVDVDKVGDSIHPVRVQRPRKIAAKSQEDGAKVVVGTPTPAQVQAQAQAQAQRVAQAQAQRAVQAAQAAQAHMSPTSNMSPRISPMTQVQSPRVQSPQVQSPQSVIGQGIPQQMQQPQQQQPQRTQTMMSGVTGMTQTPVQSVGSPSLQMASPAASVTSPQNAIGAVSQMSSPSMQSVQNMDMNNALQARQRAILQQKRHQQQERIRQLAQTHGMTEQQVIARIQQQQQQRQQQRARAFQQQFAQLSPDQKQQYLQQRRRQMLQRQQQQQQQQQQFNGMSPQVHSQVPSQVPSQVSSQVQSPQNQRATPQQPGTPQSPMGQFNNNPAQLFNGMNF